MRKTIITIVLFFAASAVVLAQGNQKMGFVNSQTIFEQLPEAIKVQSDLDAMLAKWQTVLDSMQNELQTSYNSYQQQAQTMTPDKRKESEQILVTKQQNMEKYRQMKFGQPNGEAYARQEELFAPVREKIRKAIEDVSKAEGMSFVFDKNENFPILLHADDQYDITFKVLDKLKRGK